MAVAFIAILVMAPASKEDPYEGTRLNATQYAPFKIASNKEDLNRVIKHYLEKEGLTSAIDYDIVLNDEVDLYGTIQVFSQNIHMKISFEPQALENGDLVLVQKGMSVGQLNLPAAYVMKFVRDQYELPEWVEIRPNEEKIYVALTDMELKSDVKVKVNHFDLTSDNIQFELLVPVQ